MITEAVDLATCLQEFNDDIKKISKGSIFLQECTFNVCMNVLQEKKIQAFAHHLSSLCELHGVKIN